MFKPPVTFSCCSCLRTWELLCKWAKCCSQFYYINDTTYVIYEIARSTSTSLNYLFVHPELCPHGQLLHRYPQGSFGTTHIYWVLSVPNWQMLAQQSLWFQLRFDFHLLPRDKFQPFHAKGFAAFTRESRRLSVECLTPERLHRKNGFLIALPFDKIKTLICFWVHRGTQSAYSIKSLYDDIDYSSNPIFLFNKLNKKHKSKQNTFPGSIIHDLLLVQKIPQTTEKN